MQFFETEVSNVFKLVQISFDWLYRNLALGNNEKEAKQQQQNWKQPACSLT